MKFLFCLVAVLSLSAQHLNASEQKADKISKSIELENCNVSCRDESCISIKEALDICLEFIKANKINFDVNASNVIVWISHSKKGMRLDFHFMKKNHRVLIITIGEDKKVISWEKTIAHM